MLTIFIWSIEHIKCAAFSPTSLDNISLIQHILSMFKQFNIQVCFNYNHCATHDFPNSVSHNRSNLEQKSKFSLHLTY